MITKHTLMVIPLLLVAWLGVLSAVNLISDEAPALVVLFPSETFLHKMPEDVAIVSATPYSVTLASPDAGFALQLYQIGARVVLPSGLTGCAALT